MIESLDPKAMEKPAARCAECDREMTHYNIFISPTNEPRLICWECQMREEKGFFTKRSFQRVSRGGVIPR